MDRAAHVGAGATGATSTASATSRGPSALPAAAAAAAGVGAGGAGGGASPAYFQICLPVTASTANTPFGALKYITLSTIIGGYAKRSDPV
jgi:hypothetical protein